MSVTVKVLSEAGYVPATVTQLYLAPSGTTAKIDAFGAYSAAGGTITVYAVPAAGTAGAANILVVKTLAANESYTFPELVNHALAPGDSLWVLASAATTVVARVTGREIR